jgi:polygalacturonase
MKKRTKMYGKRMFAPLLLSFALYSCSHQLTPVVIPTENQVGSLVMPVEIAPVIGAPFEIPDFKRPIFPNLTVSITERGAKEGTYVTGIINGLIDEVSAKGGGTVVVPAGKWFSGRITLKKNVNFHIAQDAVLEFSGRVEDYLPAVFTRHEGVEMLASGAFIYANGQHNIAVTGKGTILGPEMNSEVRTRLNTAANVDIDVPPSMPLSERVFDGMKGRDFQPPRTIAPINCTNVFIEGVTMNRSAIWNVVPTYCENVIIRGITVNSLEIPRGDGIDVESSKNVLIEYCTLNCGDDCFTLKSGRGEEGVRIGRPTENVIIRYSLAQQGHGAITCGSETAGNIKNIYAHDCVFNGTYSGIRFKAFRPRGGGTENILYERIRMKEVNIAFIWDMLGSHRWIGDLADRLPLRKITKLTPVLRNIHVKDFIVESAENFISANCIPEIPVSNVLIENGEIKTTSLISVLNDVDGFTLRNLNIHAQDNKINILDGKNIRFDHVRFDIPEGEIAVDIKGVKSTGIILRNGNQDIEVKPASNRLILQDGVVFKVE